MSEPLLAAKGITVRFGGLLALDTVDLEVAPIGITGLIGPNGAGKTTLFNVITGLQRPDSGALLLDGRDVCRWSPQRRAHAGMSRTFQRLELFTGMTVRDNLLGAWEASIPRGALGRRAQEGREVVEHMITRLGLQSVAVRAAGDLSTGLGRMVELGRALCTQPRLLLLDEPSSGLDAIETARFRDLLLEVTAAGAAERNGLTAPAVLLVEHDVKLVMEICSRISVLDFGRMIANGTPQEVRTNPAVIQSYLGSSAA